MIVNETAIHQMTGLLTSTGPITACNDELLSTPKIKRKSAGQLIYFSLQTFFS